MKPTHAVAGIDPHKHTATIAILDLRGGLHETASFAITPDGLGELLTFLTETELVIDRIGVEGSGALGRPLVVALTAVGYDVREVQANRTAERRRRRRRAKTDIDDADAIARETLSDPHLPPAGKHSAPDPAWDQLTVLSDWRASLILQRVRLLTEAEAVLVSLPIAIRTVLPSTSRVLPQLNALADMLLGQLQRSDRLKVERLLASLADITTLTSRIKDLDKQIPILLAELGCTLTDICGIGPVLAMQLLVEIGDPQRFRAEGQFARWCGIAPVALSSGEGHGPARRHRLDLGGNRAVNSILHTVHVTQVRCHQPAKDFMDRKTSANKTKREARRSHKRQLANVIIRHMWRDDDHRQDRRQRRPTAALTAAA
ncbi:IS110 family transposase [Actinomadura darangshiensis]|uniref:IS110 family transposase n=1 Tax=Actinomadura darangshiensis TaxID=705336 RepID=UPI00140980A9|nr:IS110 family transposase [Actinomadura darangshiensis]